MKQTIKMGTMLVEDGTQMPESLVIDTAPYSGGWSSIENSTSGLLRTGLETAGWTFFYMAGEIRTIGFGFNDQSRMDRAVTKVIKAVKLQDCNCLEITQMRRRSFLGLPYASFVAHARHIQKSPSFHDRSKAPVRASASASEQNFVHR